MTKVMTYYDPEQGVMKKVQLPDGSGFDERSSIPAMFAPSDGSAAVAAGQVGETLTASLASGSATSLSTGTAKDIITVSLTAGIWVVWGCVVFLGNAWTTVPATPATVGINTTTNTLPTALDQQATSHQTITTTSSTQIVEATQLYVRISATTVYRLIAQATFSAGTCTAYGTITAARIR